ncbi:hypothetical protein O2W18_03095 [Modestobacter sp. VKM Ac-2983]|uniref:hypothetical protein n=1 Tax=Modestobacter sp. VKM Ac-2983 TaxID=3004137 RepID=UPI0022AB91F4|nr:hypothetical protein [Modestobacter sp. VKM Ac-2983]MCZ2804082.1 hypothetical protein [Modestobacter sp. VKM Ac-2983]
MPSAVLDAPRPTPAAARPVRLPATVVAAGGLSVLEALGLLALGLTSLEGVFGSGVRPSGWLVAGTLLLLAGWVVLCAGGGAGLVDGAGRLLLVAVASAEIALLAVLCAVGLVGAGGTWLVAIGPLGGLPVPALALLALAVPTGKLLLATSPSAVAWVAAGGRPRPARRAAAVEHRALRGVTLAGIGLALTAVALVGVPAGDVPAPSTVAVTDAP